MFESIASSYDKANATLSFGLHKIWNQKLVVEIQDANSLLDLCAGTGEIAFTFLKKKPLAKVQLLDFSPEMLAIASKKGSTLGLQFETIVGDAQKLPFLEKSVEAITIAYGIRNIANPLLCFQESFRTLLPGGKLAILELTRPPFFLLRAGHFLYLKTLLPLVGKWIARNQSAYQYLARSIRDFASPSTLHIQLKSAGFKEVTTKSLHGGIATLLIARKCDN